MVRRLMGCENCDLYDILAFLAYETTPLERARRVELVRRDYYPHLDIPLQQLIEFFMIQYERNGYKEMAMENLSTLIKMKYGSMYDATRALNMNVGQIQGSYLEFQRELYKPLGVRGGVSFNINIDTYNDNSRHISLN